MKDLLISTLEPLGYPIILQGSLPEDVSYPESFFTFWNNSVEGSSLYDDDEHSFIWDFDLNFYSSNPQLVSIALEQAKKLLKEQGFIVFGKGHDVGSDEPTHTGRGINLTIFEHKED